MYPCTPHVPMCPPMYYPPRTTPHVARPDVVGARQAVEMAKQTDYTFEASREGELCEVRKRGRGERWLERERERERQTEREDGRKTEENGYEREEKCV